MMRYTDRIPWVLVIIGMTLLLVSITYDASIDFKPELLPNQYSCFTFETSGSVYLQLDQEFSHAIDLYVLDYSDTVLLIENISLEGTTPLHVYSNITEFTGIISIDSTGIYTILVDPVEDIRMDVDLTIYRIDLLNSILYPGLTMLVVGTLLIIIQAWRLKSQDSLIERSPNAY
ncbi:MAG: hypothetical protein RTU92_02315 [Candidatus Thorarchaeota archaeon]